MRTVLVTGATGTQGGAVVDHLLASDRPWAVRGLTRDATSEAARALDERGVTVVEGDMTDAERMETLLADVDAVYCVTAYANGGREGDIAQGVTVAEAAAAADVDQFVYSSVGNAGDAVGVNIFEAKHAVEQRIAELGLPATVVRPTFFLQNFAGPGMREDILDGQLALPLADGVSLAAVDTDDIGQAGAAALADPDRFVGETVTLAGDELTLAEFAAAFSDYLGRDVEPVSVDMAAFREAMGDDYADMYEWFNEGGYDVDIEGLAERHGIQPTSFREYLERSDAWRPASAPAE
ncbi:NmrA/HSCARG family protein [Haloarcula sp. S1CR25-12]|uniref:NmrA/HSCARG family protein n=1 Tax=Haloarcula saliterrae TaxID=2950534 RepID=A0ABU2FCJ8_9EURY|nr:NmrA/HSCARG family protein [Haloarcula sp. S1CR25-12]MDS0259984.1 NmrA/HSCARG family protein [Haloarcula sp. S1CR25-12]